MQHDMNPRDKVRNHIKIIQLSAMPFVSFVSFPHAAQCLYVSTGPQVPSRLTPAPARGYLKVIGVRPRSAEIDSRSECEVRVR